MKKSFRLGLDIGSTTIKCIVLDENDVVVYSNYQRHYAHIKESLVKLLREIASKNIYTDNLYVAMSGSAGMGIANAINIPFIQEVYATRISAKKFLPNTDVIIELGGEDAKILFISNRLEVRMNGTCAGGTGAFIDQMATLLNVDIKDIDELAKKYEKKYIIASRCGVFAKTDVQPLLNQGAKKSDIAASILQSVVNQTIGGLAQGREIKGNIVYLGGPLTFISELRRFFDETLKVHGVLPENSLYYVALGASLLADKEITISDLINEVEQYNSSGEYLTNEPLFKTQEELDAFRRRHAKAKVDILDLDNYKKPLYLGVDSGSTTLKLVLIDDDLNIRYEKYLSNEGNPVILLKNLLIDLYEKYPYINIASSCSTGYGEDLIKHAFNLDNGIVETMAHFMSARYFLPEVSFVIDIGGQDIKCFRIENGIVSNIFLNEACSSGCGSFLQTFANALGYEMEEFAKMGLLAKKPVDLGSRCTVFMNSSIKQAQKDGATIDNISAGLSMSVVKNALYKVIRVTDVEELGKHIVVQGGTFYNEAVLRAFERELNLEVVRPNISGIMGAFGAAMNAKNHSIGKSKILNIDQLRNFKHKITNTNCGLCPNKCALSINLFSNGEKYISGNKCEKPLSKKVAGPEYNLYAYIQQKILSYQPIKNKRGVIGIPLVLNNYELFPFWYSFFSSLGYEVRNSGFSNQATYLLGQHTIPSDTVCYPAKMVHGHIEKLVNEGIKDIFYPCMSYNFDEGKGDNHYNCPVVAYYPETIRNNVDCLRDVNFIKDYISVNDKNIFIDKMLFIVRRRLNNEITKKEIKIASQKAYQEYYDYLSDLRIRGQQIIEKARKNNKRIIVLAGRPYHVDPGVNHSIDKLITSFDVALVTEESVSHLVEKFKTNVLNQWTYHARLYSAAKFTTMHKDINLIQLVSFGCGLDAITADETKLLLESHNKIYTQIKIDEITNMGAIKIRLRSLFEALNQQEGKKNV